jgi:hypothetical protein
MTKTSRPPARSDRNVEVVAGIEDGEVIDAASEAAARRVREEIARGKLREQRRRELWGSGGADGVARLCRAFPSLRNAPGKGVESPASSRGLTRSGQRKPSCVASGGPARPPDAHGPGAVYETSHAPTSM